MKVQKYSSAEIENYNRITSEIKKLRNSADQLYELLKEAKETQIWKLKYKTWQEYCETECQITRQWANRLLNRDFLAIENTPKPKRKPLKTKTGETQFTSESPVIDVEPSPELAQPLNPPKSEPLPTRITADNLADVASKLASHRDRPRKDFNPYISDHTPTSPPPQTIPEPTETFTPDPKDLHLHPWASYSLLILRQTFSNLDPKPSKDTSKALKLLADALRTHGQKPLPQIILPTNGNH